MKTLADRLEMITIESLLMALALEQGYWFVALVMFLMVANHIVVWVQEKEDG